MTLTGWTLFAVPVSIDYADCCDWLLVGATEWGGLLARPVGVPDVAASATATLVALSEGDGSPLRAGDFGLAASAGWGSFAEEAAMVGCLEGAMVGFSRPKKRRMAHGMWSK